MFYRWREKELGAGCRWEIGRETVDGGRAEHFHRTTAGDGSAAAATETAAPAELDEKRDGQPRRRDRDNGHRRGRDERDAEQRPGRRALAADTAQTQIPHRELFDRSRPDRSFQSDILSCGQPGRVRGESFVVQWNAVTFSVLSVRSNEAGEKTVENIHENYNNRRNNCIRSVYGDN